MGSRRAGTKRRMRGVYWPTAMALAVAWVEMWLMLSHHWSMPRLAATCLHLPCSLGR